MERRAASIGVLIVLSAALLAFVPLPASTRGQSTQESTWIGVRSGGSGHGADTIPAAITQTLSLPFVSRGTCQAIDGESYGTVAVIGGGDGRPAEGHPDLNLAVRSWARTTAYLGLVTYEASPDSPPDGSAPQLAGLFGDGRVPGFSSAYRVYDWDWTCDCRGSLLDTYEVTLAGMVTAANEVIHVPASGYDIGRRSTGYEVMVLYAAANRLTLKYTREDSVVLGYTIHLENLCVDPNLLSLYQTMNAAGRSRLPSLYSGQGIGRAIGSEIAVAIRDTGMFLDPRSRTDWWQGK